MVPLAVPLGSCVRRNKTFATSMPGQLSTVSLRQLVAPICEPRRHSTSVTSSAEVTTPKGQASPCRSGGEQLEASAGHSGATPSQDSATSQLSAAARQREPLVFRVQSSAQQAPG